jgi:hypothetical protein
MSDFSELCPLFNSGVFREITFPSIALSGVSICANALDGTLRMTSTARVGYFTFGRTVVVTGAFARRDGANSVWVDLMLQHRTSGMAVGTTFGSLTISVTLSGLEIYTWAPFTIAAGKTFTSDAVLGLTVGSAVAGSTGVYDLIVRYRDK